MHLQILEYFERLNLFLEVFVSGLRLAESRHSYYFSGVVDGVNLASTFLDELFCDNAYNSGNPAACSMFQCLFLNEHSVRYSLLC